MNKVKYIPASSITTMHLLLIFDVVYPAEAKSNYSNTYKLNKISPILVSGPGFIMVTPEQLIEIKKIELEDFSSTIKPKSAQELAAMNKDCGCGG